MEGHHDAQRQTPQRQARRIRTPDAGQTFQREEQAMADELSSPYLTGRI
jgi:hypothetical protein